MSQSIDSTGRSEKIYKRSILGGSLHSLRGVSLLLGYKGKSFGKKLSLFC